MTWRNFSTQLSTDLHQSFAHKFTVIFCKHSDLTCWRIQHKDIHPFCISKKFSTQFLHIDLHQFFISNFCRQTYCNSLQAFRLDLLKNSAQRPTSVLYISSLHTSLLQICASAGAWLDHEMRYTILCTQFYCSSLQTLRPNVHASQAWTVGLASAASALQNAGHLGLGNHWTRLDLQLLQRSCGLLAPRYTTSKQVWW